MYQWDPAKAEANLIKHGVMIEAAEEFDWWSALMIYDDKHSSGEHRYIAIGLIRRRLHVMSWTPRGASLRIIGLRKANAREQRLYDAKT